MHYHIRALAERYNPIYGQGLETPEKAGICDWRELERKKREESVEALLYMYSDPLIVYIKKEAATKCLTIKVSITNNEAFTVVILSAFPP